MPTISEAGEFLSNTNSAKRAQWIDTLLASSDYADNFANKWTALLRNKRGEPTFIEGRETGALPGLLLRHGGAATTKAEQPALSGATT